MSIQSNFPNLKPSLLLDFANTKQLDNRVTFTRSTPAVYYDGKTTAMAEQNLVLQSQTFDVSPWTNAQISVTANATTAPDGTTTADKLVENNVNTTHAVYQSIGTTSGSCTFSVYAKADTRSWLNLTAYVAGARNTWFDLTNGVVGTVASGCTATITSVGNGWYRCSVTTTGGATTYFECWLANGNNVTTYAGDGTSGLFVWGAQLEQRSTATAYTPTTTQPITNYIPVLLTAGGNQPRFDCNPTTGESLGLLVEEQRTNSLLYSGAINSTNWLITQASADANTIVAPDGTLTGSKIYVGSGLTQGNAYATPTYTYGSANTGSVYFKAGEFGWGVLELRGTDNSQKSAWFNLLTGVVGTVASGVTATITPVGNGWYRCTVSAVLSSGASTTRYRMYPTNADNTYTTGNGFSGIYVWGAQLETGASFATSYIPTTSASATRTVDSAVMTGTNFSSWFNNGQGTFYAEQYITNVTAGSANNQAAASLYKDSNNFIATGQGVGDGGGTGQKSVAWVQNNNSTQFFAVTGNFITVGLTLKNAVAYETNNFAYSANTQTLITDSAGFVPSVTTLGIGFYPIASYYYANNPIRKIAYYPIRVTNAQLQALTS